MFAHTVYGLIKIQCWSERQLFAATADYFIFFHKLIDHIVILVQQFSVRVK